MRTDDVDGAVPTPARTHGRIAALVRRAVIAGLIAGAAMVPIGVALRQTGHAVNVYGELLVSAVLGRPTPLALGLLHGIVSVSLAAPFVVLTAGRQRPSIVLGALYGGASWAVLNATILPWLFGRLTTWSTGVTAAWPSILVHVVYGAVLGAAVARMANADRGARQSSVRGRTEEPRGL